MTPFSFLAELSNHNMNESQTYKLTNRTNDTMCKTEVMTHTFTII